MAVIWKLRVDFQLQNIERKFTKFNRKSIEGYAVKIPSTSDENEICCEFAQF